MAQSIADVLQSTGRIPPISASALQPPPGTDIFGPLLKQSQEDSAELKAKGKQVSARIEDDEKKIDELKVPKIPELTPAPKPQQSDPFQSFGSAAGWIAVFGSMLTRAPLTSSLNAAAGAMKAAQENNAQAFKQNFDVWKVETENALKLHQFEMDSYKQSLDKIKAGDDSALADIQVTAASFKNDTLQLLAAKGQADEVKAYLKAQTDQSKKAAESADKTEAFGLYQQGIFEYKKSHNGQEPPPELAAKMLQEFTNPSKAASATEQKNAESMKELTDVRGDVKNLSDQLGEDSSLVATKGLLRRGYQTVVGQTAEEQATDLSSEQFKQDLLGLQARVGKLVLNARYFSGPAQKEVQQLLPGLSAFDDPGRVKASLKTLDHILAERESEKGAVDIAPELGTSPKYKVGDTVASPDGKKFKITGFDSDGTPLGDPVQ